MQIFQDAKGLLRVETELVCSEKNDTFKFPFLMRYKHEIVKRLIVEQHKISLHAGVQTLIGKLGELFLIIKGRKMVEDIISECVICERTHIFNQDKSIKDVTPQGQETCTISQKRPHSEISPPIQNPAKELEPSTIPSSQVKEKLKSQIHNQSVESLVAPAKKLFDDNPADFPLDYSQIVSFLEDLFGTLDPLSIVRRYTGEVHTLLNILTKIYPALTERSIKTRITKLKKKILKQLNGELETDSNISVSKNESDISVETF
ncbi:hypothetical protein JTB14_038195 [Gonioctena quinquepunctata]|nr:hypothetical protein JTB14_038195 [Gonioctena quinquepunctata]